MRVDRASTGAAAATLICALAILQPAYGGDKPIPEGTWVFVEEGSDEIEDAIEEAASHLNILIRRTARRRLRNANAQIERIVISYQGDDVHISLQSDEPTIITPRDGSVVPYTREDGEVVQANTDMKEKRIRQFFDSDDGKKEMIYRLRPDGTMAVESTIFSDRLKEPFKYTWIFRLRE